MITIETFCRNCKEPVDIPVGLEAVDVEIMAAIGRVGVSRCQRCMPPRRTNVVTVQTVQAELAREVTSQHNDP